MFPYILTVTKILAILIFQGLRITLNLFHYDKLTIANRLPYQVI